MSEITRPSRSSWTLDSDRPRYDETNRNHNRRLAVDIYDKLYRLESNNKPFTNPSIITEMIATGSGNWIGPFNRVCRFLEDLRQEARAANPMKELLKDYFGVLFHHYRRFKRLPTIKQLNGPTIESNFIAFIHSREKEDGEYWGSKALYDRIAFGTKYGYGSKVYDPIFPDLWSGPGDPLSVASLNENKRPKSLSFIDLVKYGLLNPPFEDIESYYRLFEPETPKEKWITGEVIQRVNPHQADRREQIFQELISKGPYAKKTPREKISRPNHESIQRVQISPIHRVERIQRETISRVQRVERIERVQ